MNTPRLGKSSALAFAGLLLLAGCALDPLRRLPPGASQEQVRVALGEPWAKWQGEDGVMRWSYPTGPMGRHTYLAEFDAAGRLARLVDVMNDRGFARLEAGKSSQEEVRRLFGQPHRVIPFARKRETAWDYRFTDAWSYPAIFSVIFDERGLVVHTVQQREFQGSERSRSR